MTAAEKAALAWLNLFDDPVVDTLKALLAEPRLPAEPDYAMWNAIREGWANVAADGKGGDWKAAYRALYAHLTAPKTKKIWRVYWKDGGGKTADIESIDGAMANARALLGCGVSVTIEHVEVPND